ncbi:MAG: hypothetical protein M3Z05_01115 [Gemmatimonadota bacterium]|nr:hypothetical protein [Gemmatimonadota bacterium]
MASHSFTRGMAIEEDDLLVVARAITMRSPLPATESVRAARLRALALVAAHLGRTLSTYARHALVNCQGTAGASDIDSDTRLLVEALRVFSVEVESISSTYADALPPDTQNRPDKAPQSHVTMNAPMSPRSAGRGNAVARSLPH